MAERSPRRTRRRCARGAMPRSVRVALAKGVGGAGGGGGDARAGDAGAQSRGASRDRRRARGDGARGAAEDQSEISDAALAKAEKQIRAPSKRATPPEKQALTQQLVNQTSS